jgi:hypothetical protein
LVDIVKRGSVVSCKHVNLHGEHDFSDEKLKDSVDWMSPSSWLYRNPRKPRENLGDYHTEAGPISEFVIGDCKKPRELAAMLSSCLP